MSKFAVRAGRSLWVNKDESRLTPYPAHAALYPTCKAASAMLAKATLLPAPDWWEKLRANGHVYGTAVIPVAELPHLIAATAYPAKGPTRGAPKAEGVTAAIRAWVQANPQATRADARAQFPDANPATVGVQFGKARQVG